MTALEFPLQLLLYEVSKDQIFALAILAICSFLVTYAIAAICKKWYIDPFFKTPFFGTRSGSGAVFWGFIIIAISLFIFIKFSSFSLLTSLLNNHLSLVLILIGFASLSGYLFYMLLFILFRKINSDKSRHVLWIIIAESLILIPFFYFIYTAVK